MNDFYILSGGEKLKIWLVKGFVENFNVLILDELINYLDEISMGFFIK